MSVVAFPSNDQIKTGAIVALRSGGANMTVELVEGAEIQCIWINSEGSIGRDRYKKHTLHVLQPVPQYDKQTSSWSNKAK